MKTILALIDFSNVTPKVLDQAYRLGRTFGSEIIIAHIIPPDPVVVEYAPVPASVDRFHGRQQDLIALRDSLASRGATVTAQQFCGPVLETILAHIGTLAPDLIVMGSHGHGALYNLIVGSVTEGIIKQGAWPVMVVPAAQATQTPPVKTATSGETTDKTPHLIGALGGSVLPP